MRFLAKVPYQDVYHLVETRIDWKLPINIGVGWTVCGQKLTDMSLHNFDANLKICPICAQKVFLEKIRGI